MTLQPNQTQHPTGWAFPPCPPDPFSPLVYPALCLGTRINNSQVFLLFSLSLGFPCGEIPAWNPRKGRQTDRRFSPWASPYHAQFLCDSILHLGTSASVWQPFSHSLSSCPAQDRARSFCSWRPKGSKGSPLQLTIECFTIPHWFPETCCHFVICELPLGVWQLISTGP